MTLDGTWRMLAIGPGPGPKNVLAERVEDGTRTVVPYAIWKHRLSRQHPGVYCPQQIRDQGGLMDVQTQVMQVTVRNTRTGRSVYDVACSDGQKRSCWDPNLAAQLNSYAGTGQTITLRVDVKPSRDGRFMNHDIQAVAGPGQQLPPDTNFQAAPMGGAPMMPAAPQVAMGGNMQPIQAATQGGNNGGDRFPPQVTTRITKLAAYDYAATVVGGIFAGSGPEAEAQAVEMLDRIAKHIYAAARSHEQAPPTAAQASVAAPIVPVAGTPQGVAEWAVAQGAPVQVGAPVEGPAVAAAQDAAAESPDVIQWD